MAGAKEIRTKIASIKSTQKITSAMEKVAVSKMRKAQERMQQGKPYAEKIQQVIGHLANASPEYQHMYMKEPKRINGVGFIVVSSDRGLCGGLNINLFKAVIKEAQYWSDKGVQVSLCVIGTKAKAFFERYSATVVANRTHLGDAPTSSQLMQPLQVMLELFNEGKLNKLYCAYNTFVNKMTQQPTVNQLLPLQADQDERLKQHRWDYIYEPDAKELLDGLLSRYVQSQVYQSVVENNACEHAARMIAMKAATDNAGDLINEFQLAYNKARQAAITQEISEIVGGAAAVS